MEDIDTVHAGRKILFVDDERNILMALNRLFFEDDYEIFTAVSGEAGLESLKQNDIQLIVSDQRMPGMAGVDFLIKAEEYAPSAAKIILTGYTDLEAAIKAINEGKVQKFITKPWNDDELKLTVKQVFEYLDLQAQNQALQKLLEERNKELVGLNETLQQKVKERTKKIVLQNQELTRLNAKLEENFYKIIRIFLSIIEIRSKEIASHCKRVSAASRFLAAEMELEEREIETIELAAMLHDIGKIGIPEKTLKKTENILTTEEKNLYRQHPLLGEQTLSPIDNLKDAAKIIRHHHENYNGSGYPDRLMADYIPIGSRIIAVVNTYDQLVNKVYMNVNNTRLRAFKALRLQSGIELDPDITIKFILLMKRHKAEVNERRELEIKPFELKSNMILSRDLFTSRGTAVFTKDRRLSPEDIKHIMDSDRIEKLFTAVYVYA
ncbi:response regulator [bacterium]|nr:response regulator [bacterium]